MSQPISADPYAPPPPALWQRHADATWAVCVGVLTCLLTVVSFPPYNASEFAYAMLVPGVFWAYRRPRFRLYAGTLLASQAVAWTVLLGWLHHVTWVGLLLLGPFIGVWVGTWFIAAWWAVPRLFGRPTPVRLIALLGLAGAWVLVEWTRSWVLGGFPWLPLAASQWQRVSILQIAAFTGAGGISFVLVAANIGFAAYAHRLFFETARGLRKRSQEFFLAMFLLLVCLAVHVVETNNRLRWTESLGRIALVQPNIPQVVKWDPASARQILDTLVQTTERAALLSAVKPELILWPESVTPLAVRGDAQVQEWTENLVRRIGIPLLLGSIAHRTADGAETWSNGAFLVEPDTGLSALSYSKRHLVPFGEYVPLRPLLGWLEKVVPIGGDFVPGDDASLIPVTLRGEEIQVAPLICYEDTYASLAGESVRAGADLLVVLTNNGWFGEGGAAYQHATHSVLRAVETRRPLLRVGNAGWSGWIDEFGGIRAVLTRGPKGETQVLPKAEGTIYFNGGTTLEIRRDRRWIGTESFYVRHGNWFNLVCAALALFTWTLLRTGSLLPLNPPPDEESA